MTIISNPVPTLTTTDLENRLATGGFTLLDVRPLAAFNGWRLQDEARGGHVPGAIAFPARWTEQLDIADVAEVLESKGIVPATPVVVYGYEPKDTDPVIDVLRRLGFSDLSVYGPGWIEWAAKPELLIETLPRYEKLVYPEWVQQLLNTGSAETYTAEAFAIFHVNFGVPEEYEDGHIPGAFYLDTNWLEDALDGWNRRTPDELEAVLRRVGITRRTTVILYGRDTVGDPNEKWPGRRAGQIAATRAASILMYAGVEDVRLLDGGYDRWVLTGYELETSGRQPVPVNESGLRIPERPELIIDIDFAKEILADPEGAALVSVRTWREHIGQVSGYNYIEPRGRIAGDVWGNCGTDAYHMQHYRNVDNTMRPYPEIAANWSEAGITADKWVAFYCGTGWRASETWFYAYLMGWTRIAVYDGGWFEWSSDPVNNQIEVGEPRDEFAA
ncbi:MAG TPA: rhodanese-like domain-containing protein [Acidimicrobiia bacterium]|jgi:thiosulfate/3-mercaptopyruvate sulfurtransferase